MGYVRRSEADLPGPSIRACRDPIGRFLRQQLGLLDLDYAFRHDAHVAPTAGEDDYDNKKEYDANSSKLERSNCLSPNDD